MNTSGQRPTTTRQKRRWSMTHHTPEQPDEENDENIRLEEELEDDSF